VKLERSFKLAETTNQAVSKDDDNIEKAFESFVFAQRENAKLNGQCLSDDQELSILDRSR
jgi:hypothetical protein